MSIHQKFYYCPECMHVYYEMPHSNECGICKNEMDENNLISNLDLMICETCNHIYTIQNPEELIHQYEGNKDFLCGCQNKCPSNALLSVGNQQMYFGNILKADIYRCSNCGAISFRNMGAQNKKCNECGANYLEAMHWDSSEFRIFYQCANPEHGIRLKLRDLIADHNQKVDNLVKSIQDEEKKLQDSYEIQLKAILKQNNSGLLQKQWLHLQRKPTPAELEMKKLNTWAFEERKKLYASLKPLALRCAVFKEQLEGNQSKLIKTSAGCAALAKIRIKKVVIAPDGTIIDSEPKSTADEGKGQVEEQLSQGFSQQPTQNQTNFSLRPEHESVFTQIIRSTEDLGIGLEENGQIIESEPKIDLILPDLDKITQSLPELKENQIYLIIFIVNREKDANKLSLFNYGVLPLEFTDEKTEIQQISVGKQHFIGAYWNEPDKILTTPYLFENILPASEQFGHFTLIKEKNTYFCEPNKFNFPIKIEQQENGGIREIEGKIEIDSKTAFIIPGYYSFTGDNPENLQNFHFKMRLITPELNHDENHQENNI